MQEKLLSVLTCFNIFVPIFSFAFFFLFRPSGIISKIIVGSPKIYVPLTNCGVIFFFSLCVIVAATSVAVIIFGNVPQRIVSTVTFTLAVLYVSLWITIYLTIV